MGNKHKAIMDAVFYSHQKPELLAVLLEGVVSDVATSLVVEGDSSIKKPETGNATGEYTAKIFSQFGDEMSGTPTLSLKESVTGVSISGSTVTVSSTVTADSFVVKATSGSLSGELLVSIE